MLDGPLETQTELEYINMLERWLICNSIIYYRLGDSIWSDGVWDRAALELVKYKDSKYFSESAHYELFRDFDGSTGMHLCLAEYNAEAGYLLWVHNGSREDEQPRERVAPEATPEQIAEWYASLF